METIVTDSYQRIAGIIDEIKDHFHGVPRVDQLAAALHTSTDELDQLFQEWGGMNAEAFLRTLGPGYAQQVLGEDEHEATLFDGLFTEEPAPVGPAHDAFMRIEPMTEEEYADGGSALQIGYAFHLTPFGRLLIAATEKGVSYAAFEPLPPAGSSRASIDPAGAVGGDPPSTQGHPTEEETPRATADMKSRFPKASYTEGTDAHQEAALAVFQRDWTNMPTVVLHMKGTEFQLKVWRSLLEIPLGDLTTYRRIATELGMPQAARAVGTAIGSNPIAWLVPCHRVVRTSGELGGYMWGPTRKAAIMGWESEWKLETRNLKQETTRRR